MRQFKSVLLAAAAFPVFAVAAHSASGTWKNPAVNSDYSTTLNWSAGSVPGSLQSATFGVSDITVVNFTANQTTGTVVFTSGSSNYTFGFGPGVTFFLNGTGVTRNLGAGAVQFNVNQAATSVTFDLSASA